jgi:hypothetical protein
MRRTVDNSILSRKDFYDGENSLYNFFSNHILARSPDDSQIEIFLVDTDEYYLIEVKIVKCDHSLSNFGDLIDEIKSDEIEHPLIKLGSEICELGTFFQLQSMCPQDSYGISVEPLENKTKAEYFNQNFGQNEEGTLYTIGFEDGISYVWETIRDFAGDYDKVRYYINNGDDNTKRVL